MPHCRQLSPVQLRRLRRVMGIHLSVTSNVSTHGEPSPAKHGTSKSARPDMISPRHGNPIEVLSVRNVLAAIFFHRAESTLMAPTWARRPSLLHKSRLQEKEWRSKFIWPSSGLRPATTFRQDCVKVPIPRDWKQRSSGKSARGSSLRNKSFQSVGQGNFFPCRTKAERVLTSLCLAAPTTKLSSPHPAAIGSCLSSAQLQRFPSPSTGPVVAGTKPIFVQPLSNVRRESAKRRRSCRCSTRRLSEVSDPRPDIRPDPTFPRSPSVPPIAKAYVPFTLDDLVPSERQSRKGHSTKCDSLAIGRREPER